MRRFAATILLIAAMAVSGTPPAWAHAVRTAADPAPDATISTGPARVSATFNEQLQSSFAAMTVVGPDGNLWSDGSPQVQGATVSVAVRPLGPAGAYTVNYRVTSADGHVVSGSWAFTLTVAGTGAPGPSASAGYPDTGLPVWPFLAGAAVILAGGAAWALRRRS
ncbi:MAG: copper resistance protein CopC [Mycobacterium sp.]